MNEIGQYGNALSDFGTRPRCECHDCTQARWRASIQGQLSGALTKTQGQPDKNSQLGQNCAEAPFQQQTHSRT